MSKCVIFYSWQSDLPNATNRGFIAEALKRAVGKLKSSGEIKVEPVVDRDTKDLTGAPNIAQSILQKIECCEIFVADVSIINRTSKFRRSPNPNVLFELGYAMKHLGSERIILIMNRAFGAPELLPFDLKMSRVISYNLPNHNAEKSAEKDKLAGILSTNIQAIIETTPIPSRLDLYFDGEIQTHTSTLSRVADNSNKDLKLDLASKIIEINTCLVNSSGAPARDIDAFLEFPEGVSVHSRSQLKSYWAFHGKDLFDADLWASLAVPRRSKSLEQAMGDVVEEMDFSAFLSHVSPGRGKPKHATNKDTMGEISNLSVKFHVAKIKQQSTQRLESLYLVLDDAELKSVDITYRITADEVTKDGVLSLVIERN